MQIITSICFDLVNISARQFLSVISPQSFFYGPFPTHASTLSVFFSFLFYENRFCQHYFSNLITIPPLGCILNVSLVTLSVVHTILPLFFFVLLKLQNTTNICLMLKKSKSPQLEVSSRLHVVDLAIKFNIGRGSTTFYLNWTGYE